MGKSAFVAPDGCYVEQEVQNPTLDTLPHITTVLEIDLKKIIAKARKAAAKQE